MDRSEIAVQEPLEPEPAEVGALGRVVVRGAAFSSAGFVLEQCLTIGAAIALAHLVSPVEFGIYGSATILLGYAAMFSDSGLQSAVIQRRDQVAEAASTAFAANVVSGLALTLLALALAPVLGAFFHSHTVGWVAAATTGTVALRSLMLVPDALLQRSFSFTRRLFVSPSAVLTYGIVTIVLCAMGLGVWGLVLGRYASIVVELAVIWALVGWRPRWAAVSIGMWRSLARYGRHIFAASFITQSRTSAVTALLGRFVSIGAIGQLRYATTMVTLPRAAWVMSSSYVVFPAFARIAGDRERFRSAFGRTLRWSAITTFPASAMLLPLGPSIAVCLLGDQWRTAGYAAMALTGVQIAGGLGSVLSEGVKGLGRPDVLSKAAVVNSVATIALSVAFLPLGITGVAGASSVGSAISIVYMTRLALPVLGVDAVSILRALRPPFVATSLMVAVLFPLEWLVVHADRHGSSAGILLLLGEGTVGLVVYLCALRVLDPDAIETLRRVARSVGARVRGRRDVRAVA